jgi:hypothetical protein
MATTPTPTGITIGIKEIKFLHYESTTRVQEIKNQLPNDAYEFQFDMQWNIAEKDKLFNILLSVTLYEKQSSETKIELANMKEHISFVVINFQEVIKKEKELISIPDQLVTVAAGIALSTARGMFVMNVKDSILNNAVIPIVNPQVFLPKKEK